MANFNGSLEAVDCHIHSVRYDMAVNRGTWGFSDDLIRSPTTLLRRRYIEQMLKPCKRCFYTIMANFYPSLEAVDRHIHSVRYDMAVNRGTCGVSDDLIRSPTTL
eukprot:scaffold5240_cov125-Skeletonema_dohrnii-CCMP3373.AAC.1